MKKETELNVQESNKVANSTTAEDVINLNPSGIIIYNNTPQTPHRAIDNKTFNKEHKAHRNGILYFKTIGEYHHYNKVIKDDMKWVEGCPWRQSNKDRWNNDLKRFINDNREYINERLENIKIYGSADYNKQLNFDWKIKLEFDVLTAPLPYTEDNDDIGDKGNFLPLIEECKDVLTVDEAREHFNEIEEHLLELKKENYGKGRYSAVTFKTLERFTINELRKYASFNDAVFEALYGIKREDAPQDEKTEDVTINKDEEWFNHTYNLIHNFNDDEDLKELKERCEERLTQRMYNELNLVLKQSEHSPRKNPIPYELKLKARELLETLKLKLAS